MLQALGKFLATHSSCTPVYTHICASTYSLALGHRQLSVWSTLSLQLCAGRQAAFKSTSPQNLSVSIEKRQGNTGWLSWAGRKGWFSSAFSKNRSTAGQLPVEYLNQAQLKNQQVNGGTYICHFGLQDWMMSPGQK